MIKAGILGSHEKTDEYLNLLNSMNTFKLIGIHDLDDKRIIDVKNRHGLKIYTHPDDLVQEADALFAAPGFNSYENLRNALRKSKHVFIDPPLNYNKQETRNLISLSDEADVVVHIGFPHRYNPAFLAARPFISPRVRMIHAHSMKQYVEENNKIHPVNDIMIHDIDNILSVVNSEIRKISAYGMSTSNASPDVVNAIIEFHNGCIANLTASKISATDLKQITFYNPANYVAIDMLKHKAYRYSKNSDAEMPLFSENFSDLVRECIPVKNANEIEDEFNAFSNSILHMKSPEISLENTSQTMRVIQEINSKIKLTSNCS
ncbi:MAG: Gfo/Idh/MocA family oxidoreductase [Bacteroidales bacterium]|nr:Gfo/Idh/MocA family oxidoreductase [Bacteroidales bacterium]